MGLELQLIITNKNSEETYFKVRIREGIDWISAQPTSIKIKPGKEELVKLTPDIKEFIDLYNKDQLSHDIKKLMSHWSDQFLNNGTNKAQVETFINTYLPYMTSSEWGITVFEPKGAKAYLAGYSTSNFGTYPLEFRLIKENGQWKVYGNQKKSQEWVIGE